MTEDVRPLEPNTKVVCDNCEWEGVIGDLDDLVRDVPFLCPQCGADELDIILDTIVF